MSHDSEEIMDVGQCDSPGCYSRSVNYAGGATVKQLAALADFSTSCRQSITASYNTCINVLFCNYLNTVVSNSIIVSNTLLSRSTVLRNRGGTTAKETRDTFGPVPMITTSTPVSVASITIAMTPSNATVTR